MPKIDVTDEGVIDATPLVTYNALLDEYRGETNWSGTLYELRGDLPIREGSIIDFTVNPKSRNKSKFAVKITKMVEGRLIEEELSGALEGIGKWTFEPTADGKTKVQVRMNARTNGLLFSLMSPFVNLGKLVSEGHQQGFKACNSHLSKK